MLGVTHNYFQDSPGGSEQGGQDYGLIAGNISSDLSNGTGYPTFDAYNATAPQHWGQSDSHFCCTAWRAGCKTTQSFGTLDPVAVTAGDPPAVVVHGWAWSSAAPQAGLAPLTVTLEVDGKAAVTVTANVSRPDLVAVAVAPSPDHGFTVGLPPALTRPLLHGKHVIKALAHAEGEEPFELDSSPRCICDFAPCACAGAALAGQHRGPR